jgi:hypothetical protein
MRSQSRRHMVRALALATALTVGACGDSSTGPGGEQEVISRVTLSLTPAGGGSAITVYIDDPDGAGPQAPSAQVGSLSLTSGASYTGSILFENRLENPPENITEEVEAEADEHRVFYTVTGTAASVTVTDVDGSARPLGLVYNVAAGGTAGAGTLRVVLCHYGDTTKPAVATSCSTDTDIDVTFNFTVAPAAP